jgi:hypothetical protein
MGSVHSTLDMSTESNRGSNSNKIIIINSLSKSQLTITQFNLMLAAINQHLPAFCTRWDFPQITVVGGQSYIPGYFGYINIIQGNNSSLGYHTLDINDISMGVVHFSAHVYDNQVLGYDWDFTGINPQNPNQPHSFLSTTLAHEIFEMIRDPTLRALGPNGEKIAFFSRDGASTPRCREVCDPVWDLEIILDLVDTRNSLNSNYKIYISNYVYPSWFILNSTGPYDALSVLTAPFECSYFNRDVTPTTDRANTYSRSSPTLSRTSASRDDLRPEPVGSTLVRGMGRSTFASSQSQGSSASSTRGAGAPVLKHNPFRSASPKRETGTPVLEYNPFRGASPTVDDNPSLNSLREKSLDKTPEDAKVVTKIFTLVKMDLNLLDTVSPTVNPIINSGAHFASHLSSSSKAARLRQRQSRSPNKPTHIITNPMLPNSTSSVLAQYKQGSIPPSSQLGYRSVSHDNISSENELLSVLSMSSKLEAHETILGVDLSDPISEKRYNPRDFIDTSVALYTSSMDPSQSQISQPGAPSLDQCSTSEIHVGLDYVNSESMLVNSHSNDTVQTRNMDLNSVSQPLNPGIPFRDPVISPKLEKVDETTDPVISTEPEKVDPTTNPVILPEPGKPDESTDPNLDNTTQSVISTALEKTFYSQIPVSELSPTTADSWQRIDLSPIVSEVELTSDTIISAGDSPLHDVYVDLPMGRELSSGVEDSDDVSVTP